MIRTLFAAAALLLAAPVAAQVTQPLTPTASTAAEAGRVLKSGVVTVYALNVVSGGTALYVMLFNATAIPADGAVAPIKCYTVAPNTTIDISYRGAPINLSTGAVVVASSTGCFTKTASATAYISGDVR